MSEIKQECIDYFKKIYVKYGHDISEWINNHDDDEWHNLRNTNIIDTDSYDYIRFNCFDITDGDNDKYICIVNQKFIDEVINAR